MRHTDLLVTPSEAVSLLRVLEPRAIPALEGETWQLTPARLRYLEQYGVAPVVAGSGVRGYARTRLYDVVNLAMLRLWARLSAEGGPALARFALAYIGDEVRQALMKRRSLVLVVRGRRAVLVKATDAAAQDAAVVVPLPALLEGVSEAVQELREERPEVWAGLAWLSPSDALQEALV